MLKITCLSDRAALLLAFVLLVSTGYSQITPSRTDTDPTNDPIKVGSEMKDAFKSWINNDVPYIITAAEKKAFLSLKTDEERENFISSFWNRRDPDPDTEVNEFRDEYYERIAYANEHFASGIPGWKTDRGRIYITWGKPDSIEAHPSGGQYDRPSYEGGGSTSTYPFETWFYRHLDGPGDGVEIEFVDPSGTGEYRISRDADEKNALAAVPGAGQKVNSSDRSSYMRTQDTPFARMELIKDLQSAPQVKLNDIAQTITHSPVIDNNPLDFDLRVDFFRQGDNRVITAFTLQTNNKELSFKPNGNIETATMNIVGRITAVSNRRAGTFEDAVTTNATSAELTDTGNNSSIYQKAIALTPGIYKVEVVVRDVATGSTGARNIGFTVPNYDTNRLSASTLILASTLRAANESEIGGLFLIGSTKVIPNLTGIYKQGQDVGIYLQVYNAETDQTTLRPGVDVKYILMKDGKEVSHQIEDWKGLSDSGQRLTLARLIPTRSLPIGEYEIKVQIIDQVREGGQKIETVGKFTITK